ncbi:uncharacterized protein BXZ73DRAFT_45696, partial [Epithele typhae]|uniref:uncharacterized protein n=1 Tax=Epithele typhae TaxID=378194 RepID=UPI00200764AA
RRKEVDSALEEIIKREFGDRVEDMYEVQGLAVTLEKQGRGYATALMRTILDKSDADGKDSWVITGRSHTFYATLGYTIVGKGQTGGENLTWPHGPVDWIVVCFAAHMYTKDALIPTLQMHRSAGRVPSP